MTTSFISRFVLLYLHCTPLARVCAPAAFERASPAPRPSDRLGPPGPRGRRRGCRCNCSVRTRRRHNQINVTRLAKLCIREGEALSSCLRRSWAGREKCLCELKTDGLNVRKCGASLLFAFPTFPPMFCSSVCIPSTFRFIARPLHLSSPPSLFPSLRLLLRLSLSLPWRI